MTRTTTVLVDGLGFPEGPRWHDGKLWFSDFRLRRVSTVGLDGELDVVIQLDDQPSGLGWLPNGDLLVVSMINKALLRWREGRLEQVADLSNLASHWCNDMVVDSRGYAYIGNFGAPLETPCAKLAEIILVKPDGSASVVARDMAFPNGPVITPDEKTLIVGETYAARLTAFDIAEDGTLSNRRVWAQFDDLGVVRERKELRKRVLPDGICLDAEGAIWVASPNERSEVLRVREGGEVIDRVTVETVPYACMLGGPDGRTLFVLTSDLSKEGKVGKIETVEVDVPGAGFP
ncbi:SMP-30/gluconolactonase/LRE family protein [Proteobacteria bacterium 005FR1]|nr:SMP-30/gluconolactonase/LRE family protein [Proteobacteria bacterium 005FR1]